MFLLVQYMQENLNQRHKLRVRNCYDIEVNSAFQYFLVANITLGIGKFMLRKYSPTILERQRGLHMIPDTIMQIIPSGFTNVNNFTC